MTELELTLLKQSQEQGRWGFKVAVQLLQGSAFVSALPFVSDALLTMDVPAWMARSWTISLAPFGFQATQGAGLAANVPTRNQVYSMATARCQLDWGVDGASCSAIVDYPAQGTQVCVVASNIRAKIFSEGGYPAGAQLPIYSGYLAPAQRSVQGAETYPTYTVPLQSVPASPSTGIFVPVPAFATAYRVFFDAQLVTNVLTLSQCDQNRNLVTFEAPTPAAGVGQSEHAGYFPLQPFAQFINVTNTDAAAHNIGIQFLLDIG